MGQAIGFIGGGKMAEAIISGLIGSNLMSADDIYVSDINNQRRHYLHEHYGVNVSDDNQWLIDQVNTVILAVKPQVMGQVLQPLTETFTKQLVISIAAGISISKLADWLPEGTPLVRVMPNTPCLIGEGISVMAGGNTVTKEQLKMAEDILASVGKTAIVEEKYLNAVTGLSGSGPAYVYLIIEAMADAGVLAGLDRELSTQLAVQTVVGAGRMVGETGNHPAQLKDAVTSPGGTTIAGLQVLERNGLRATLMEAVTTAMKRAAELNEE